MADELPIVKRLRAGPVFHSISDMQTMHEAAALITELVAAMEPFALNTPLPDGTIVGLERWHFERARAVREKVKK